MSTGINPAAIPAVRAYATIHTTNRDDDGRRQEWRDLPGRHPGEYAYAGHVPAGDRHHGTIKMTFTPDEPITVDLPNANPIALAELRIYRAADDVHLATIDTADIPTRPENTCTWSLRG